MSDFMRSYMRSLSEYRPLQRTLSIGALNLNSENTATVNLRHCQTTTTMIDRFLQEGRDYLILEDVFIYSRPAGQEWHTISLICTPTKRGYPSIRHGNLPSLSMLKQATIDQADFSCPLAKRLHPIALSIINALRQNGYKHGYFLIADPEPFKAQCSADRSGFGKEWYGPNIVYEKNYGDCSAYFAVIGFQSY